MSMGKQCKGMCITVANKECLWVQACFLPYMGKFQSIIMQV